MEGFPDQPEVPVCCNDCGAPVWFDSESDRYIDANGDAYCEASPYNDGLHITYGDPPMLRRYGNLLPEIEALLGPGIHEKVKCPVCPDSKVIGGFEESLLGIGPGNLVGSIWSQIPHLNDFHEWSREAIAEWLNTLPYDLTVTVPKEFDR